MNAKTRRAFSVFVCLMVFLSIASYGGLAASWESDDLKLFQSVDISGDLGSRGEGLWWAQNGSKLYVADSGGEIFHYDVDVPYDPSTLTLNDSQSGFGDTASIAVSPDGMKVFVSDPIDDRIEQFNLSEAWNISSGDGSPDASANWGGDIKNNNGFTFNDTGEEMIAVTEQEGNTQANGGIYVFELGAPYDLQSTTITSSNTSIGYDAMDVRYGDSGTKLYVLQGRAQGGHGIFQYDLPDPYNVTSRENETSVGIPGVDSANNIDWDNDGSNLLVLEGQSLEDFTTKNHTVSGHVNDGAGQPIDGATVTLNTTGGETVTNSSGFYQFAVDNGTHKFTANFDEKQENSTTVVVNGSDVTGANITLFDKTNLTIEGPSHMWHNESDSVVVKEDGTDVTDNATLTSSNTDLLTVSDDGTLESTSNLSRNGEVQITATFEGKEATTNVTVANLSAEHANLMQNAADMTAALWGDPIHPETGERQGGTQLTMRIIFVATLVGAGFANKINGFAGVAGFLLVITAGWFMNWIGLGLLLLTVVGTLFVGLNTAQLRSRRFGA